MTMMHSYCHCITYCELETYISILITAWFLLQVTKSCKTHGGFYLGSIGGPAAVLASNSIKKVEVLEYPELGKFI